MFQFCGMNELFPVRVKCHSGYKADEYPKRFTFEKRKIEISEILDRWYQYDTVAGFPEANYFKVLSNEGKQYIIKHETKNDQWFLVIRGECLNL